ncbi:MAG TPA: DUF5606 domain-containing protein [Bacteroidales bacterium]|nr:DUF5606 domain-containing protein [Bacteroidales bacterium]
MELREILSIGGKPGLYKMVKQTSNGMIVESLDDQRRFPVFAHDQISSLEEISIFTDTEDMPLRDVLKNIAGKHENGPAINPKKTSADDLKDYFLEVVPEYDEDRVYVSHIKKIISWYNALQRNNLLELLEEEEKPEEESKDGESPKEEKE